ncbi:MAG: glycine cleavage system protein GcvH [Atribacterota bacterium]|nr:glycine cleavage system protein GcvH [Atribacterota bacterium]MDD4896002.1 glycine cleavage system protein GcvH [Atribacterota bacterium]MDD5638059.1 glycine cleavage system protein GcvH [Atribacterota bacterium]
MSIKVLEGLYYSKSDEWIKVENDVGTIGITDYAQDQLGDIVFVEEIEKGKQLNKGDVITTVESVKAVSEVYSPISGEVIEVNQTIIDEPSQINKDPFGEGWFAKIKMSKPDETKELMSASDYSEYRKE